MSQNLFNRLWNGPYSFWGYYAFVSIGSALITAVLLGFEGYALYSGFETIPGATHISETFFSGVLAAVITGIILHRHATKAGQCLTLQHHGRCPFLEILTMGLALGGLATLAVWWFQGTGEVPYADLFCAKVMQGALTGIVLPPLFHIFGLLRHPGIRYE